MRALAFGMGAVAVVAGAYGCSGTDAVREEPTGETSEAITVCATSTAVRGIDVSSYQGTINWAAAAAGGVKFAQIRLANVLKDDTTFTANWNGAKANGILRGAYQYFNPNVDPAAQANKMIDGLKKAGFVPGDLPPEIDVEWSANDIPGPTAYANAIRTWINMVKAAFGVAPLIYAGGPYWESNVKSSEWAANPLWHPEYPNYPNTIYQMNANPAPLAGCPKYLGAAMPKWTFWQFAGENGRAPGVSGAVDINIFNGTMADLQKLARVPGTEPDAGADAGKDAQADGGDSGASGSSGDPTGPGPSSSGGASGADPSPTPDADGGPVDASDGGGCNMHGSPATPGVGFVVVAIGLVLARRRRSLYGTPIADDG